MDFSHDDLRSSREKYHYVPARLVDAARKEPDFEWIGKQICLQLIADCPTQREWDNSQFRTRYSSVAIDEFHGRFLNSAIETESLHGLASCIFWGFASGSDGIIRVERALGKARCLAKGRGSPESSRRIIPQPIGEITTVIKQARELLAKGDVEDALNCAMNIQFLGMSFASKLLMFVKPSAAVVYDRVIARSLDANPSQPLRAIASEAKKHNHKIRARAYSNWCEYCAETAFKMNGLGENFEWTDWDGSRQRWRAVDIERAIFALAAD